MSISEITPRHDKFIFKVMEINNHLKDFCVTEKIPLNENSNFNSRYHSNSRGLNSKGNIKLANVFLKYINALTLCLRTKWL